MNQQTYVFIRWLLVIATQGLANHGFASAETVTWLGGDMTLTILGEIGSGLVLLWGWWSTRPHAVIASANALPQVDAVVVAAKTAAEMQTPGVVSVAPAGTPASNG